VLPAAAAPPWLALLPVPAGAARAPGRAGLGVLGAGLGGGSGLLAATGARPAPPPCLPARPCRLPASFFFRRRLPSAARVSSRRLAAESRVRPALSGPLPSACPAFRARAGPCFPGRPFFGLGALLVPAALCAAYPRSPWPAPSDLRLAGRSLSPGPLASALLGLGCPAPSPRFVVSVGLARAAWAPVALLLRFWWSPRSLCSWRLRSYPIYTTSSLPAGSVPCCPVIPAVPPGPAYRRAPAPAAPRLGRLFMALWALFLSPGFAPLASSAAPGLGGAASSLSLLRTLSLSPSPPFPRPSVPVSPWRAFSALLAP